MNNEQLSTQAGDWLADAVKRKPEALLLLAAGCAMLLYSGRRPTRSPVARWEMGDDTLWDPNAAPARSPSSVVSTVTGRAAEFAGEMADKVSATADTLSDTAKTYAANVADSVTGYADTARRTVSNYADDARRNLTETSDRVFAGAGSTYQSAAEIIREQPILVGALGLVAGATIAALFPASDAEKRTLGAVGSTVTQKATEVGEQLAGAVGKAGERLQEAAAERGLSAEGLKDIARDVAGTFATAAGGSDSPSHKGPVSTPGANKASDPGSSTAASTTLGSGTYGGPSNRMTSKEGKAPDGSSRNGPHRA